MTQERYEKFVPLASADGGGHQSYIAGAAAATVFIPGQARGILMQALTQNIRYTLDGTNPTTATGFQLKAGDPPRYIELDHRVFLKVIREAAGAVLEYEFCDVNNGGTLS